MRIIILLTALFISQIAMSSVVEVQFGEHKLSFNEITPEQYEKAKEIISSIDYLDFNSMNDCEARASWMRWELLAQGISSTNIYLSGGDLINNWNYHFGTAVKVKGIESPMVFDRAVAHLGPIELSDWLSKLTLDEGYYLTGEYTSKVKMLILNHYCSVFENQSGNKKIDSFNDSDLSSHARNLFSRLNELNLIEDRWTPNSPKEKFSCKNRGLEY